MRLIWATASKPEEKCLGGLADHYGHVTELWAKVCEQKWGAHFCHVLKRNRHTHTLTDFSFPSAGTPIQWWELELLQGSRDDGRPVLR